MSPLASARRRWPLSPRPLRVAAWAALVLFTVIVVTGAGVRLTGSGLGCDDWPRCAENSLTPQSEQGGHALIEFGNRMITTPVAIAALLCLVFALLRRDRRRDLDLLGAGLVLSVVAQAVLGGIAVLTELNWWSVAGHFLLSMVALVLCVLLVWKVERERSGRPEKPPTDRLVVRTVKVLSALGAFVVVLGTLVTAAGPNAGGAGTGDEVARLTSLGGDSFPQFVMLHARVAAAFGVWAVLVWLLAWRRGARDARNALTAVCLLVAIAGVVGQLQYHVLDYPAWLVWIHVSLSAVLWNTIVWAWLAAGRARSSAADDALDDSGDRDDAAGEPDRDSALEQQTPAPA